MTKRRGFTLIELSIVIVIISLVVSVVVVGKSMITAAELRTITSEETMYATAFKEFIDKYQALPGDMNNAASLWGIDAPCPPTLPTTNNIPKVATCNGDGTGTIGNWTNGATIPNVSYLNMEYEWFRAWQHLSNAGLIEAKFTGARGAASSTTTNPGVNVPLSKTGKAGWTIMWMNSTSIADNDFFYSATLAENLASHVLIYGAQTPASFTDSIILTPSDAKHIDTKMDDGMPYTGNVRVKRANADTCATPIISGPSPYPGPYTYNPTSDYLLNPDLTIYTGLLPSISKDSLGCQLIFILGM